MKTLRITVTFKSELSSSVVNAYKMCTKKTKDFKCVQKDFKDFRNKAFLVKIATFKKKT